MLESGDPFGCAEHLVAFTVDDYAPFPGLDCPKPGAFGPIYEIRTYLLRPGGLAPTLAGWAEALPPRTQVSPLTLAMYALGGVPRITHIWPYPSLDERARARTEAVMRGSGRPRV